MARSKVLPGKRLKIGVQLGTGLTGKFVDALLKNADTGAVLFSSPIDLVDRGGGTYSPTSVTDPVWPTVTPPISIACAYRVFDDVGKLIPSEDDQIGEDFFELDDASQEIISRFDAINARSFTTLRGSLVLRSSIDGKLIDDTKILGSIESPRIDGQVKTETLVGTLSRPSLRGVIKCQ